MPAGFCALGDHNIAADIAPHARAGRAAGERTAHPASLPMLALPYDQPAASGDRPRWPPGISVLRSAENCRTSMLHLRDNPPTGYGCSENTQRRLVGAHGRPPVFQPRSSNSTLALVPAVSMPHENVTMTSWSWQLAGSRTGAASPPRWPLALIPSRRSDAIPARGGKKRR